MRAAIYARVSTRDKEQDPQTQLLPLREFVQAQHGWTAAGEFVDTASASDLRGRKEWSRLLDLAAKRKVDVILCWKLDRAFRSVAHMATTVEQLRRWNVGLRSYSEPWLGTSGTSPVADLMLNILASFAQFEKALIAERVKAGLQRARKQGRVLGHPTVLSRLNGQWTETRKRIEAAELSYWQAAEILGCGRWIATAPRTNRRAAFMGGSSPLPGAITRKGGDWEGCPRRLQV